MKYYKCEKLVILFIILISLTSQILAEPNQFWKEYDFFSTQPTEITAAPDGSLWFTTNSGEYQNNQGVYVKNGDSWQYFTTENSGLPDNKVLTCEIDNTGVVWLGTYRGLVKYDNGNWEVFNTNNSEIPSNIVQFIACDSTGGVWCASYQNLSYFKGESWKDYSFYETYYDKINCITVDFKNNLWVGTRTLRQFNGGKWHLYDRNNSLISSWVWFISVSPDSILYFSTGRGITAFDGINWVSYEGPGNHEAVAMDSKGIVWTGSDTSIDCFDGSSWCSIPTWTTPIGAKNPISSIDVDNNDIVWILTENKVYTFSGTIVSMNETEKEIYKQGETVALNWFSSDSHTIDIQYSNDGEKTWTEIANGINSDQKMYYWTIPDTLVSEPFLNKSIAIRILGNDVYISRDKISFTVERINPGDALIEFDLLCNQCGRVTCFAEDKSGAIWAGMSHGLCRYKDNTWQVFLLGLIDTLFIDPEMQTILDCTADSNGEMWFGLKAGLLHYDGETWETFLSGKYVSNVATGPAGEIWVAAAEENNKQYALYLFNGGNYIQVPSPWGEATDLLTAMEVSPDGRLFLFRRELSYSINGTLATYDGYKWQMFNDAEGAPPHHPTKFVWDTYGNLWTFDTEVPNYIHKFSFQENKWINIPDKWNAIDPPQEFAKDIAIDNHGKLWFAVDGKLMLLNENQSEYIFTYPYSTSYGWDIGYINTIYIDRNNVKWLGGRGIYRLDETLLPMTVEIESPEAFTLLQNYPNPFNVSTVISYTILERADIELTIYNITGQRVRILVKGNFEPGTYKVVWDGTDENGKTISSGMYFASLSTESGIQIRKMIYMK